VSNFKRQSNARSNRALWCWLLTCALVLSGALGSLHRAAHPYAGVLSSQHDHDHHHDHDHDHDDNAARATEAKSLVSPHWDTLFGHAEGADCSSYGGLLSSPWHCTSLDTTVVVKLASAPVAALPSLLFRAAPQSRAHARDPPRAV
jgi:hypothetical protein